MANIGHGPRGAGGRSMGARGYTLAAAFAAPLFGLLLPALSAAQEVGPRPPRLTDLTPRSTLVLGAEFADLDDASGLSLPISARIQISEELAFEVEVPFGYVDDPGAVVEPLVGNLGVGLVGSAMDRLGPAGTIRWGLEISGRLPTAPSADDPARAERVSRLRSVTPFRGERWSPDAAAARVSVAAAYGSRELTGQLQAGVLAALPTGERAATAHGHWGLMLGYRVYQNIWGQIEVAGAQVAPGASEERAGHYVTGAVAIRFLTLRASPVFYVAFPIVGDVEGERPVVFGAEVATW